MLFLFIINDILMFKFIIDIILFVIWFNFFGLKLNLEFFVIVLLFSLMRIFLYFDNDYIFIK